MERKTLGRMNLGKNGITDNFIETLRTYFKTHNNVKVNLLKSVDRTEKAKYAEEIVSKLGKNYSFKVIGFVINIKKWRKEIN